MLACKLCTCPYSTETTEIILYQEHNNTHRKNYNWNQKRKICQISDKFIRPEIEDSIYESDAKIRSTNLTYSKMPSFDLNNHNKGQSSVKNVFISDIKLEQEQIKIIDSQISENKQNININEIVESIKYQSILPSPQISLNSSPKISISKLQLNKLKSTRLSLLEMNNGQRNSMLSPNLNNSCQKSLTAILLEKQNYQLKEELNKLRKQEVQLIQEQKKMTEKNNRELANMKRRCFELQKKGQTRKSQIVELNNLLKIAKRKKIKPMKQCSKQYRRENQIIRSKQNSQYYY